MKRLGWIMLLAPLAGCLVDTPHLGTPADGVIHVVCLGDSNSRQPLNADTPRWCDYLTGLYAERAPISSPLNATIEVHNFAFAFSTACDFGQAAPFTSDHQLDAALVDPNARPDIVLAAFGTNDVNVQYSRFSKNSDPADDLSTEHLLACFRRLRDRVSAAGAQLLIATTPPAYVLSPTVNVAAWNLLAAYLNLRLRQTFPSFQILDFDSWVTPAHEFADDSHLNDLGQHERARRAYSASQWPCGDGVVEPEGAEECDDGNSIEGDGCEPNCKLS